MRIAVIGTGYVGLVTGTCFAEMGNEVICVDIDEKKVERLKQGQMPIYEPGLEIFLERNLREGRLRFTLDLAEAIEPAQAVFMALPTPPGEDGSADLSYILGAGGDVADLLAANPDWGYKVIVDKSTVPVGTSDKMRQTFEARGLEAGTHFDVALEPRVSARGRGGRRLYEARARRRRCRLGPSQGRYDPALRAVRALG